MQLYEDELPLSELPPQRPELTPPPSQQHAVLAPRRLALETPVVVADEDRVNLEGYFVSFIYYIFYLFCSLLATTPRNCSCRDTKKHQATTTEGIWSCLLIELPKA